jgi:hypothetical protein
MALLPSVLALAILLVTQASAFGDTGAQTKTNPAAGAAVVIAIICYSARKKPIGGWLLYYYISLYAGLAFSLLLLATTLQNYSPARWQSTELYALAIASTTLGQLILIMQPVVATILLKCREWKWLRLLRTILIGGVIWSAISVVLDSAFFSQGLAALDCLTFVWLVIWLAYFFQIRASETRFSFQGLGFSYANSAAS